MKCYGVIDTNVLVSALLAKREDSATVKIVRRLFDGIVVPVFSREMMCEYHEVLRRPKFKFSAAAVESFLSAFSRSGVCIESGASGLMRGASAKEMVSSLSPDAGMRRPPNGYFVVRFASGYLQCLDCFAMLAMTDGVVLD